MNLELALIQIFEDDFIEQLSESELSCYEPAFIEILEHLKKTDEYNNLTSNT